MRKVADRHKARFGCEGKRKCDFWVILTLLKDLKEKKDLLHMHFEDWTQVNYPLNLELKKTLPKSRFRDWEDIS